MQAKVSKWGAAITMTRLCIGSGLLALPYASQRGGLLFSPLGLLFIAGWNGIACLQLIDCRNNIPTDAEIPASISSTYARVAYCGMGWKGVAAADFSVFITLIGVCVSSQINIGTLIKDVIGEAVDLNTLIIVSAFVVYPISCFRNMSGLAKMSPVGMFCLLLNIGAIVGYGVALYWDQITSITMPMWPSSLPDMAAYSGVAIFCFGLCSLVFQVEESMEHSEQFGSALGLCLVIVCFAYLFVGDGVALLYSHAPGGINGNVLLNLPQHDFLSVFSRFAMVAACVLYYPLALLPPANIFERICFNVCNSLFGMKHDAPNSSDKPTLPSAANTSSASAVELTRLLPASASNNNYTPADGNGNAESQNNRIALGLESVVQSGSGRSRTGSDLGLSTGFSRPRTGSDLGVPLSNAPTSVLPAFNEPPYLFMCACRAVLVVITTAVAIKVPCFEAIITLLGCFTISVVSFILPPWLHLNLVSKRALAAIENDSQYLRLYQVNVDVSGSDGGDIESAEQHRIEIAIELKSARCMYIVDYGLLVAGVLMCIGSTFVTVMDIRHQLSSGHC